MMASYRTTPTHPTCLQFAGCATSHIISMWQPRTGRRRTVNIVMTSAPPTRSSFSSLYSALLQSRLLWLHCRSGYQRTHSNSYSSSGMSPPRSITCKLALHQSNNRIHPLRTRLGPCSHRPNKFKILVGFYQIATRVERVYEIVMPSEVAGLLRFFQFAISIGIEGIPLACIGADGYIARLVFWIVLPAVVVGVASSVGVARLMLVSQGRATRAALLDATLPAILRIFFLSYPIVTNVAFEGEFECSTTPPT